MSSRINSPRRSPGSLQDEFLVVEWKLAESKQRTVDEDNLRHMLNAFRGAAQALEVRHRLNKPPTERRQRQRRRFHDFVTLIPLSKSFEPDVANRVTAFCVNESDGGCGLLCRSPLLFQLCVVHFANLHGRDAKFVAMICRQAATQRGLYDVGLIYQQALQLPPSTQ